MKPKNSVADIPTIVKLDIPDDIKDNILVDGIGFGGLSHKCREDIECFKSMIDQGGKKIPVECHIDRGGGITSVSVVQNLPRYPVETYLIVM